MIRPYCNGRISEMAGSETSKGLVKKALSGKKVPFLPFIPWVCSHAAKLEQIPLRHMLNEASVLARALENAQKLYGYDMVVNIFDSTIEAEACGCPVKWSSEEGLPILESHHPIDNLSENDISNVISRGRLPVVIEATKRLRITLGRTVAVAGVVTGPFTLASHLKGQNIAVALERDPEKAGDIVDLAGKVCLEVCKSYCELEVDAIVLAESVLPQLSQRFFPMALSVLAPLCNVIRFYNGLFLLLASGCTRESIGLMTKIEADAMAVDSTLEAYLKQNASSCIVGHSIPCSVLQGPKDQLTAHLDNHLKGHHAGTFLSTEWQVPYDTPPENMHQITEYVRKL